MVICRITFFFKSYISRLLQYLFGEILKRYYCQVMMFLSVLHHPYSLTVVCVFLMLAKRRKLQKIYWIKQGHLGWSYIFISWVITQCKLKMATRRSLFWEYLCFIIYYVDFHFGKNILLTDIKHSSQTTMWHVIPTNWV